MLILATDTSAAVCCGAIYDTDKKQIIARTEINNKLTHSVTLMPVLTGLLQNAQIKPDEIDLYAVSTGPGSFTGLRIGISAIKGMAYAGGKKCVGVSSADAMAYNFCGSITDAVICTTIDARVGRVFTATYKAEKGEISLITPDRCITAEELSNELMQYDMPVILTGDGAELIKAKANRDNIIIAPIDKRYPTGYAVALAAENKEPVSPNQLMPAYMQLPQAQRELMAKNENMKGSTQC